MLNSENIREDGVYLLENGEDSLIYVGNVVEPTILEQIFGVSSLAALPSQVSMLNVSFFCWNVWSKFNCITDNY